MDKKNELIAQSNALTSSRYDFSPTEKNVLYHDINKASHSSNPGTIPCDHRANRYGHRQRRPRQNR